MGRYNQIKYTSRLMAVLLVLTLLVFIAPHVQADEYSGECGDNLTWSFSAGTLTITDGELFAKGIHISPYEKGNLFNRDPLRERRLLMHKKEILKLRALSEKDGYTLIPLSLYFKKGRVKVEVGVCRGKKLYDKRESALKRDLERENRRGIKLSDRD